MRTKGDRRFNERYPCDQPEMDAGNNAVLRHRLYTYPACGRSDGKKKGMPETMPPSDRHGRHSPAAAAVLKWKKTLPNVEEDVVQEDLLACSSDDHRCGCPDDWQERQRVKRRSLSYPVRKEDVALCYRLGLKSIPSRPSVLTAPRKNQAPVKSHLPLIRELSEGDGDDRTAFGRLVERELSILQHVQKRSPASCKVNRTIQSDVSGQRYTTWRGLECNAVPSNRKRCTLDANRARRLPDM